MRRAIATCPTDRPRQRLFERGPAALSDLELVALLLGTGHESSGDPLAHGLLLRFHSLRGIACAGRAQLLQLKGMGPARAAMIAAAAELGRRIASESLEHGTCVSSPAAVQAHFGPLLVDEKREQFYALLLDSRNRLIQRARISEGSLGASLVHPREAFRPAIREAAAAVLFLHNHPSGDPSPSREDGRITERLRKAGELLGIPVLDHVIIGSRSYFSFADGGW